MDSNIEISRRGALARTIWAVLSVPAPAASSRNQDLESDQSRQRINILNILRLGSIQLITLPRTASINLLPQAIDTPEWSMRGQSPPRREDHVVFPEHTTLLGERVLGWEFDEADGLVWGCGFVPYDTGVFRGVVLRKRAELDLVPLDV